MDLNVIEDVQRLILNRISWKLLLETPKETSILILRELFEDGVCSEVEENVSDWINFSLNEWFIFKKYDQFVISVASVLLGLRVAGLEQQILIVVDLIKKYALGDLPFIQTCIQYMVALMNQNEEEEGEIEILPLQSTGHSEDVNSLQDDSDSTFCQTPCGVKRPIPTVKTLKKTKRIRLNKEKGRKQVFVVMSEKHNNKSMHKNRQAKISEFVKKEKQTKQQKKKK